MLYEVIVMKMHSSKIGHFQSHICGNVCKWLRYYGTQQRLAWWLWCTAPARVTCVRRCTAKCIMYTDQCKAPQRISGNPALFAGVSLVHIYTCAASLYLVLGKLMLVPYVYCSVLFHNNKWWMKCYVYFVIVLVCVWWQ